MEWSIESAEWVRHLTDEDIIDAAGPGAFQRGRDYATRGRVLHATTLNGGRAIAAKVSGSRSTAYQTVISFDRSSTTSEPTWTSHCSCPVTLECKHAVAVLISVRENLGGYVDPAAASDAPLISTWELSLSGLARSSTAPSDRATVQGTPMGLIIERVQAVAERHESVDRIRLRPTRRTAAGTWSKKFAWSEVDTLGYPSYRQRTRNRPDHSRALSFLLSLHRQSETVQSRSYGSPYGHTMHLDSFGPEVWTALRRIRDTGVALLADEDGDQVTVLDHPAQALIDIGRTSDGLQLTPHVTADLDGEDVSGLRVQLIGSPAHGLAALSRTRIRALVPLADELDPAVEGLIVTQDGLHVPEQDVPRFLAFYLPRLRELITVVSSDGSVQLPEPSPPRLQVLVRSSGDRHGITVDFGFAYKTPDGTAVLPAGSLDAPRDRQGEQDLIDGIPPLAEIPGALGPGTDSLRRALRPRVLLHGAAAIRFVTESIPQLEADPRIDLEVSDDVPTFEELVDTPSISLSGATLDQTSSGSDWFDLDITVTIGEIEVPFEPLFRALVQGEEIMHLETGEWFRLDHPVLTGLHRLIDEARGLAEADAGTVRLNRYQVDLWQDLSELADVDLAQENAWRSNIEALQTIGEIDPVSPPESLQATLRPYQLDGFRWLSTLWDARLGGILADDMGLGKTIQVLALVARAMDAEGADDDSRPILVVAPTSVVGTWESEARRFVPHLDVRSITQTHRRRGEDVAAAVAGAQLVITSYSVLRLDGEEFAAVDWRALVLDEAQFVKNARAKTHQALRRLSAPFVLAVTGTPLENDLMDLWALLALTAPGLFPRQDRFAEVYRRPIESGEHPERLERLRRRIRPFLLRRTKAQVALDLPPKQVQVLPVELTPGHRRIYDLHLQRERKRVLGLLENPEGNRVAILAALTTLRQLSLDPALVEDVQHGRGSPAKIDVLVEHLRELAEEGHRALVFSQFTRFLRTVRDRLDAEGIGTCYLDGRTRNRSKVIAEFREGTADAFLISLKAGGTGLTLTEADYVFILDPWWNPATEAQAIDRVHRIGQDKPVLVYRLVSTGTIEEKVVALQDRKRDLFTKVVDDGGSLTGAVTAEDIKALLDVDA